MSLPFYDEISQAIFAERTQPPIVTGQGKLPSAYPVTELATATIGAAGRALSRLTGPADVTVDRRLASLWFDMTLRPLGWEVPSVWDSIAGNYQAADRWIRLHTNAPHHKVAALKVLKCEEDRSAVATAVREWPAAELEQAIVDAGGCAARQLTTREWLNLPEGNAVVDQPLVDWQWHDTANTASASTETTPTEMLAGIRVLDLTRVLAGPVASRFLAGFGATVLRIDPAHWDEPGVIPEVNPGKFSAGLDLTDANDRRTFEHLLATADVLLHGYRSDALSGLGYDATARRNINPQLVDVSLNAYGHRGPWATRRGFDSLVQMSIGITAYGQTMLESDQPVPLPVQALDHGTGYLLAATVLEGLHQRRLGRTSTARLSLARTGHLLMSEPAPEDDEPTIKLQDDDFGRAEENTDWGPARRVRPPVQIGDIAPVWKMPSGFLRRHAAAWPD